MNVLKVLCLEMLKAAKLTSGVLSLIAAIPLTEVLYFLLQICVLSQCNLWFQLFLLITKHNEVSHQRHKRLFRMSEKELHLLS